MELIKLVPTEHECSWTANKEREQYRRRRYAQLENGLRQIQGLCPRPSPQAKMKECYKIGCTVESANKGESLHAFQIEQPGQLPGVPERSGFVPANAWGESCNQLKKWTESNPGTMPRRASTNKDEIKLTP